MDQERLRREAELFERACGLAGPDRSSFLDEACGADAGLRAELESLLARDARTSAGSPLDELRERLAAPGLGRDAAPSVPERIGPYRVLSLLGAGGMGVVYRAEQANPRRIIALKMLRPGSVLPESRRRFQREARLLARLKHPGIAQVYEAGTAEASAGAQPYFAMELVEGRPLSDFAAATALGERQRIELAARLCDAVQHAHERGVIHRDLKPANVLVEGSGQPKILDFGVARATEQDLLLTTLRTRPGELVGTVAYMSPEQAKGDPTRLDARTDVYSLGVILYELLTGRLPYPVLGKPLAEAVRTIEEGDPEPLSRTKRHFHGDLETIVATALAKERERRYASAGELAGDLRRYLDDLPIVARPATTLYHLRKFARRHRSLVAAVAGIFLVLVLAVIVSTSLAVRESSARATAQEQARKAEQVTSFVLEVFTPPQGAIDRGSFSVEEILARAAERVDLELSDQPAVAADVSYVIGLFYSVLDRKAEALPLLETAAEAHRRTADEDPERLLRTLKTLVGTLGPQRHYDRMRPIQEEVLALTNRLYGRESPEYRRALSGLANMVGMGGELEESIAVKRAILQSLAVPETERARLRFLLAADLYRNGEFTEAEQLLRSGIADPPPSDDACWNLFQLAFLLADTGRYREAERHSAEMMRCLGGPAAQPSIALAYGLYLQAHLRRRQGHLAEAEELAREALPVLDWHGAAPGFALRELGEALLAQGRVHEAEDAFRSALSHQTKTEDGGWYVAQARTNLARVLCALGDLEAAAELGQRALDDMCCALRNDHPRVADCLVPLAQTLVLLGEHQQAEGLCLEALAIRTACMSAHSAPVAEVWEVLAAARLGQGDVGGAEVLCRDALAVYEATFDLEHPARAGALTGLARCHAARGELAEAETLHRHALFLRRERLGPEHPAVAESLAELGALLAARGRAEEAGSLLRESLAIRRTALGDSHPATEGARSALASLDLPGPR